MSVPIYPAGYPQILQSGYTLKTAPNMVRTQMADGYARQRTVNSGKPASLSVNLSMSGEEYNKFTTWLNQNTQGGAGWFMIPILTSDTSDGSPQYKTVRIQNGEISAALAWRSGTETRWKISFTLDVAVAPLPAEKDDSAAYMIMGGVLMAATVEENDNDLLQTMPVITHSTVYSVGDYSVVESSDNIG